MGYNYNTDPFLFVNAKDHYAKSHRVLRVVEGHIHVAGEGYVARFSNNADAIACLVQAGYTRTDDKGGIAFRPV